MLVECGRSSSKLSPFYRPLASSGSSYLLIGVVFEVEAIVIVDYGNQLLCRSLSRVFDTPRRDIYIRLGRTCIHCGPATLPRRQTSPLFARPRMVHVATSGILDLVSHSEAEDIDTLVLVRRLPQMMPQRKRSSPRLPKIFILPSLFLPRLTRLPQFPTITMAFPSSPVLLPVVVLLPPVRR